MQAEDNKRKIHPPGHETHGVHICYKCGWTFPNPHPSAKQRRAHKKICGKIDGFKLIDCEDSDNDVSDDPSESTDILQPNDVTQGNQIRNPGASKTEPVNLDHGIHAQDHTLLSTDLVGQSISDINADSLVAEPEGDKASPVEPETQVYDYVEKANTDTGEEVIEWSMTEAGPNLDAEGNENNAIVEKPPTVETLPSIPTSDCSEIDSKLHEMGVMDASSEDMVFDFKEPDSTICYAHEQTDASGLQNLQNVAIPNTQQGSMETEGDEYLGDFVGTAQVPEGGLRVDSKQEVNIDNQSDMVESCGPYGQHEKVETKPPNFSTSTDVLVQYRSETKPEVCKDGGSVQQEASLTSAFSDATGSTEVHLTNPVPVEAHSGFMLVKSGETADIFPSSMQVQEDNLQVDGTGNKTTQEKLIVDQSGLDGHHIDEGSQFVRLYSDRCAAEGLRSNEPEAHPEISDGESIVNKATILDDVVASSSKMDATGNHLEENKLDSSFGEEEPHHGLLHEIVPETLVIDAARGSTLVSARGTVVCQETAMNIGGYDTAYKESREDHTVGIGGHCQGRAKEIHHPSSTEITHESANDEFEAKPRIHANLGMDELLGNQQINESHLSGTDASLEGMDSHSHHLDNSSEPYAKQRNNLDAVSQESIVELALGKCADPSVVRTEAHVVQNETDSGPSGHLHEELKSNQGSEVGLCQIYTQNPTPEMHACSSSLSLENCCSSDFSQGDASDINYHSAQEGGNHTILKQNSNASVLAMDASVDSISQTDSVEGYWGSVSDLEPVTYAFGEVVGTDGTVLSARDATDAQMLTSTEAAPNIIIRTSMELSNAVLKKGGTTKEHRTDSTDLFEAPSFMTLVEPGKGTNRRPASAEIQSDQKSQRPNSPTSRDGWFPTLTNVVNESQGRKKNEEIIAKVVNWSSGQTHAPLSRLLVEASLDSKHKSLMAQERTALAATHEGQVSQDIRSPGKATTKMSTVSTAKGSTDEEGNSQARLPISKREKRKIWIPFVCCSSINSV